MIYAQPLWLLDGFGSYPPTANHQYRCHSS